MSNLKSSPIELPSPRAKLSAEDVRACAGLPKFDHTVREKPMPALPYEPES